MMLGVTRDVVIVGGGIAGLSAAWRLRHRDVLLLEAGDRLGGRMRSEAHGEYWLNHGAHLFPAPGTLVDSMLRDCGLETVPVTGGMMGLAVGSKRLGGRLDRTQAARRVLGERDAGLGGEHAARGAHEQVGAEDLLELSNLLGDRGL